MIKCWKYGVAPPQKCRIEVEKYRIRRGELTYHLAAHKKEALELATLKTSWILEFKKDILSDLFCRQLVIFISSYHLIFLLRHGRKLKKKLFHQESKWLWKKTKNCFYFRTDKNLFLNDVNDIFCWNSQLCMTHFQQTKKTLLKNRI